MAAVCTAALEGYKGKQDTEDRQYLNGRRPSLHMLEAAPHRGGSGLHADRPAPERAQLFES